MADRSMTRRIAISSVLGSALIAGAANAHPQGNVARLLPYAVGAGLLFAWWCHDASGRPAASRAVGWWAILISGAVLVNIAAFEPIRYAECGTIAEELGNASCLRASDAAGPVLMAVAVLVAGSMLAGSRNRGAR